jgi:soluble lytic murein transglycosylase-like protein
LNRTSTRPLSRAPARWDSFDPKQNLDAGIRHLQSLLEKYDDLSSALAAYNAGGTAVERYGGIPPFRETQNYVRRVLEFYRGGTPSS